MMNPYMNRSMNCHMNKPMDCSMNKPMDCSMNKPMDCSMNRPMDRSMNKPMDCSMNKPMDCSMNKSMNQHQMMHWINTVSFAVNDITLYLDTHPTDQKALEYYRHYHQLRLEALAAYEKAYGPLTLDSYCADGEWKWSTQNPPWKGEIC